MLMGEHAVLHKGRAISAALDRRISVHAKRREDDKVIITSSLGSYQATKDLLTPDPKFSFILACLEGYSHGVELTVESQFSHTVGFGSSAAVTVATLGALYGRDKLFEKSLKVIRKVQGTASGADVAASIYGGVVLYKMDPCEITVLSPSLPITTVYSGSKMATKEVIKLVQEAQKAHPRAYEAIFCQMDALIDEAVVAIQNNDLVTLGKLFNIHHGLQEALGTCNRSLAEIVHTLRETPGILGAKISGSGLGDSCIGLGISGIAVGEGVCFDH